MMKTQRIILTIIGVLVALGLTRETLAQSINEMGYQAYISNSRTIWERAIAKAEPGSFELAMAQYGYLNGTMADRNEDAFDQYYDATLDLLDELISAEDHVAECKALKSSIYGLAMAYDGWKGMFLGPKSSSLISEAYEASPDNPLVVKLYASSKLYTPEMFGGNPKEALKEFQRSVDLFESSGMAEKNWLYMDALAHLGITYRNLGQPAQAIRVYEKALEIEPNYGWVKGSLLPSAKNALASK